MQILSITKYRKLYLETYVYDEFGKDRIFTDWCGEQYKFLAITFDHAFSESSNYRTSVGVHDICFSQKRARRILWIKEALALSAGTIERYSQLRVTDRGRRARRRTLVVVEERYVIVFDNPKGPGLPYLFVTAFPADKSYIERLRKTSSLVETKRIIR